MGILKQFGIDKNSRQRKSAKKVAEVSIEKYEKTAMQWLKKQIQNN